MKNNTLTPQIRFKGFEEGWKAKKLGELGSTYSGLSGKTREDFGHGNARFITYMNVFTNPIASSSMIEAVEQDQSQTPVKYGDILFTTSSETPDEVGMSSVWKYSIPDMYLNSFCFGYRLSQKVELDYIAYYLRSTVFRSNMKILAQGISRYNISKSQVMELPVQLPSLDEQAAIGDYFRRVDELITEAEREVSRLEKMKQASLQKMFPRPGESVPEVRFAGFTEEWKTVRLGDCASFSRGQGYTKNDLQESGTPIFLYGRLYTKYSTYVESVDTFSFITSFSIMSRGGEVVMPSSGETAEDIAVASAILSKGIILGGGLNIIIPKDGVDSIFLALSLTYGSAHKELAKKAQGKSVVHIYNQDIADLSVSFPESLAEQAAIGEYFRNLDSLIDARRRRVAKLRDIKKACLDKMFAASVP